MYNDKSTAVLIAHSKACLHTDTEESNAQNTFLQLHTATLPGVEHALNLSRLPWPGNLPILPGFTRGEEIGQASSTAGVNSTAQLAALNTHFHTVAPSSPRNKVARAIQGAHRKSAPTFIETIGKAPLHLGPQTGATTTVALPLLIRTCITSALIQHAYIIIIMNVIYCLLCTLFF